MVNGRKALGASGALRLGFEQAISLWPATLFLFLGYAAQALVLPGFLVLIRARVGLGSGALFLGALWLTTQLVRALALGGAVREASLRMRGLPSGGFLRETLAASPRVGGYLIVGFFVDLLVSCYRWAALLAAGGAFVTAFFKGWAVGLFSSAALALAILVCIPLGLAATVWMQAALARAVARDEGFLASLYATAGSLWARPWPPLVVVIVTGVLGWSAELVLSLFTRLGAASGERGWVVLIWAQLTSGVLAGFLWAVLEAARVDGLAALELDAPPAAPEPAPLLPPEPAPGLPQS